MSACGARGGWGGALKVMERRDAGDGERYS